MDSPPERPWLPHLRGAFVAFHILAVCVLSTPDLSGGLTRKAWQSPMVQAEFQQWAARLGTDPETLEERAWTAAHSWSTLRDKLLIPFGPYREYLGVRQRWRMFAAPNTIPARLRVAVEIEGRWQTVYVARSTEHTWMARQLDQERLRVIVNRAAWRQHLPHYKRLAEWLADAAARDFPEATRIQLSYLRGKTPTRAQAQAGEVAELKEERRLRRELGSRR